MRRVPPAVALFASVPLLLSAGSPAPARSNAPRAVRPALLATMELATSAGRDYLKPGEPATVTGRLVDRKDRAVGGTVTLGVYDAGGTELGRLPDVRTAPDGTFRATVPTSVTKNVRPTRFTKYRELLTVRAIDARAGKTRAAKAGAASILVAAAVPGIELENNFTSAVGWVKPGETYPFRVIVRNYDAADAGVVVTVPDVDGMTFQQVEPSAGTATIGGTGDITWTIGGVDAGTATEPEVVTLIVEGRALSTGEDEQVVWKNISTTATLVRDGADPITSASHGPKVIPPDEIFDTARYGDRPFPVVPVDYFERTHTAEHTGELLAQKINDPAIEGSTFNLFQENSYKQLFPHGTVPSVEAESPEWPAEAVNFTDPDPPVPNGCPPDGLVTAEPLQGTDGVYGERIVDGWYRLPGTTGYYGTDRYGPFTGYLGAVAGQSLLFDIDSACGPTGKAVYDAAAIADPDLDYSDYDTDKDGVVDFFMMVYAGVGGHGQSQTEGYDNIWPHSSSLEFYYEDTETGLTGYVSQDQLKDLLGRPLWYTDEQRAAMTTQDTGEELIVRVRVGPYNVNPESAIDKASVISHEYGHSLGLPDFYSTGDRDTYGDWNLMATDKSQNMDVFSKQDMGWIVPKILKPNDTHTASGWRDSKVNTHEITWTTPDGEEYTLEGPDVANGEAYTAKLRGRQLISPEKIAQGASPSHVWWSGSGNDFGCAPEKGHNFDIALPELANVADGTTVTLEFTSYWDIEWDYDYGFVLISPDHGDTYTSVPSENGYTTPSTQNPNTNGCQTRYGNGITGSSGSYEAGTAPVDRVSGAASGTQYPDGPFLADSYDISALAGADQPVLRFSYATDPGLLLVYTDEAHGYGNAGTDDPPAQSPLDQEPEAGSSTPDLNDAAFSEGESWSDAGWTDNYEDPSTESGNWEFRFNCLHFKVDDMAGDDIGPDSAVGVGGNLIGDVTFRTTKACAEFNYGYGDESGNFAPIARLAVKPSSPRVGQPATFDASQSEDDKQASSDLTYAWDFGDGSTGKGRTVSHAYAKAGTYTVTLTVTDADGARNRVTQEVTVSAAAPPPGGSGGMPATGASPVLPILAVLGAGAAVLMRRRVVSNFHDH